MTSLVISLPIQAQEITGTQVENYDFLADINPDDIIDIPTPTESASPGNFKLRLLKEYLILKVELAKQNIIDHKKAYLALFVLLTGCTIGCCTYKK